MVRVGKRLPGDVPRRFPFHAMLVDKDTNELGDRERRMRVVELNRIFLVEARKVGRRLQVDAHHVLQRAADEEVLLLEPELLARQRGIVGIEHLADGLGGNLFLDRAVIVADVERFEVERVDRLGAPQAQQVRRVDAIAEDRRIVGDPSDDARRLPANAHAAVLVGVRFGLAAETHVERNLGAWDFPWVAEAKPPVAHLHLPAVADLLVEDPELVADAVADRRDLQGCERIEVAGREPSQAPVAEAGLFFLLEEALEIEAELCHRLPRGVEASEVDEVVAEMRAEQELGGQIGDCAYLVPIVRLGRPGRALEQAVAHAVGKGEILVVGGGGLREAAQDGEEVSLEYPLPGFDFGTAMHVGQLGRPRFRPWNAAPGRSTKVDRHPLPLGEVEGIFWLVASRTYLPGGTGSGDALVERSATNVPSSAFTLAARHDNSRQVGRTATISEGA